MRPTRVLHVSQPTEAGVAAVLKAYLGSPDPRVDHVVACPAGGTLAPDVVALGHEHVPWVAGREPGRGVAPEVRALQRIVREQRPDVVHLHSSKAGLTGRLALRGGVPTVFQPHAWSFSAVRGVTRAASLSWERAAQRWTHATILVSEDERTRGYRAGVLRPGGPREGHVLANAVDVGCWPVMDRSAARARLGIPLDTPTAVCVGRLCRQKGQDLLLAAWPEVTAALGLPRRPGGGPGPLLVLVGDGPDRADLERLRPPGTRLVGADDPHAWYAAADVVVVPSRWEAMAMVPLEAQASARLVVATDVDGVREGLHPEQVVVPPERPEALTAALVRALTDRAEASAVGARVRALAERRWSPHEARRRLMDVYATAIAAGGGRCARS